MRAVGLWNKALVVVDPDHGISFHGDDLRRDPTRTNLSDLAFIPFFVKLPEQKTGRVVDTHITTEDILPTIADVLGVAMDPEWQGTSLLPLANGAGEYQYVSISSSYENSHAGRMGNWKLQLKGGGTPRLWNLAKDPGEDSDVWDKAHVPARMLLDAIPDIHMSGRARTPVQGEVPNPLHPPAGCAFNPRCPFANERCRVERPALLPAGAVRVACHAVEEGRI